ncbi:hypothetical protein D7I39_15480 [Allopusillimonas ginsengisoli]|nr:hypothetical protein D7I39_15480 [Allopusillimonas ginsengisoli]
MKESTTTLDSQGASFGDEVLPFTDLREDEELPFVMQDGAVMLRGSRSQSSGSMAFPERYVCLETGSRDMEPFLFGPDGKLYSYTTIHVSSTRTVPYTLGYVDFPNGVRVLAHIEQDDANAPIACDQPVQLRATGARWFVVPVTKQSGV